MPFRSKNDNLQSPSPQLTPGGTLKKEQLMAILEAVSNGSKSLEDAARALTADELHEANRIYATVDLDRQKRTGFPEVIFGEGKSAQQIAGILKRLNDAGQNAFATRVDAEKAACIQEELEGTSYNAMARILHREVHPIEKTGRGTIGILCAGTSDLPVAEEAACVAELLGNSIHRITDVGVAGVHRLLRHTEALSQCQVLVVVAGMEGALPSVVAGLTDRPVIAVPTSVGYGSSFGGLTALLGMLNSCATGISVVNIDNGFGAAYQAALINRLP